MLLLVNTGNVKRLQKALRNVVNIVFLNQEINIVGNINKSIFLISKTLQKRPIQIKQNRILLGHQHLII